MSLSTRIYIQFPPSAPFENTDSIVLTFETYYIDLRIPRHDYTSIDWAFAGTKSSPAPNRSVWKHLIDSREFMGEDSGEFTEMDNGDAMEKGEMVNPETGVKGPYVEVWRTIPVEAGAIAYCLESEERRFVGRIGLYYVCMGQDAKGFSTRRYQLERRKWRKVYHIGEMTLPGPEEVENANLTTGAKVHFDGVVYTVREHFTV